MPLAEPERPRKMLPPPMTRASSTPMSSNPPISLQMVPTVSGSIPVFCSPARASPLSLSSTRLYLSSAICSALVEAGHAGCCFHGSSDTEQQAFGRALFIIAKNVAISKHFYHAAPAGRHGTALCKAACTTGAGTPYGKGRRMAGATCAPARRLLPCPAGTSLPFPRPGGHAEKHPASFPSASPGMPLSPPPASSPDGESVANGRPDTHTTPPGNATGAGAYLPAPAFCGIGKSPEPKPRADPARSPHARMQQPF